jgi:hypothetical protein
VSAKGAMGIDGVRGFGMHLRLVKAKQRPSGAGAGEDSDSLTSASEPGTPPVDLGAQGGASQWAGCQQVEQR